MRPVPKTAIVTGASGWIGQAIARRLAREGAALALVARSAEPLKVLAESLRSGGGRAVVLPGDVADPQFHNGLIARAAEELGGLELLVNNAGVEDFQHFHDQDPAEIASAVAVNLTGPLVLMRHAVAYMRSTEVGGAIVNVSSTAGLVGTPYGVVYSATKAALRIATASVRMEYAGTNVRASSICPGFVVGGGMHEEQRRVAGDAPKVLGSATADDVAEAVLRAARKDIAEVIVNSRPMRPLLPIERLSPSLGLSLTRVMSGPYMQKVADARARAKGGGAG